MSTHEPDQGDLDERLEGLFENYDGLRERCRFRSSSRVAGEIARLAKSEQRVVPYLRAQFSVMNDAQSLLEPRLGRDVAVELIALLESEDRARLMQPDFPEQEYYQTVGWMSACAYDNLAKHTAMMQGYNSTGMHGCISEGIQVCRRTGKLRCITCFREYAADVYQSADDLDMALHFARLVSTLAPDAPGSERRWVGARDETWVHLLQGRLDAAEVACRQALQLAEKYHTPLAARAESLVYLEDILLLAGRHDEFEREFGAARDAAGLPAGEFPSQDLRQAQRDALQAVIGGDGAKAVQLLTHWDRWLTEHECLHEWFEVRLRLLATHRLLGNAARLESLGRPLAERACEACDWLTLRRLERVLDVNEVASPLALPYPLSSGLFAGTGSQVPVPDELPPEAAAASATQPETSEEPSQFDDALAAWFTRLQQAPEDESVRDAVLAEMLSVAPAEVSHPADAARLIHFVRLLAADGRRAREVWSWAEQLAGGFAEQAVIVNLLATLADVLRCADDPALAEAISKDLVEQLFRKSLDLDAGNAGNFGRAGAFYLGEDNLGEAERYLARGFRLARTDGFLALQLADVYERTDRPRDALAVLDLSLREGCDDPDVAWQAALSALQLEQYEALLTYLERFEGLRPGQPWVHFYRAIGLLECGRPQEALEALAEEGQRNPDQPFAADILRACAAAALGQSEAFRQLLDQVLSVPLAPVDYLTVRGQTDLFARLWKAAACLAADDPLRQELEARMLAAGMGHDDFFKAERQRAEAVNGVNFYRCTVLQPLDERWPEWPGCLAGQQEWPAYRALWGVLAHDEDEAAKIAAAGQGRCYPLPAAVEDIELQSEGYTDKPGIVWQGARGEAKADDDAPA